MKLTITYDREMLLAANRRFILRSFGWRNAGLFLLLPIGWCYLYLTGERGWLLGGLGAAILMLVLLWIVVYRTYVKHSFDRLEQMTRKQVDIDFSDETVSMCSDLGAASVPWRQFIELWRYTDMWMLFHAKNAFVTLPARDLTQEAMSFIERKVSEAGGKIA